MSEILTGVSACLPGERGLVTPRETIRLVGRGDGSVSSGPRAEITPPPCGAGADTVMGELCKQDLSGFVLDKRSPSCGLERVRVWDEGAQRPSRRGRGVFAQALVDATPGLAIEEEGRAGARRHQRGARPSERPTTAGAALAAQPLLSAPP